MMLRALLCVGGGIAEKGEQSDGEKAGDREQDEEQTPAEGVDKERAENIEEDVGGEATGHVEAHGGCSSVGRELARDQQEARREDE
ncbi:hypothetical protein JCM18899A_10450 [Nocardioides sp. AN3]